MKQILLILVILVSANSIADDARPVLVQIEAEVANTYRVLFRVPNNGRLLASPKLVVPTGCKLLHSSETMTNDSRLQHSTLSCETTLQGETFEINYPSINPGLFHLFRYTDNSGQHSSQLQKPSQTRWQIPQELSSTIVIQEYIILGIEHIWAGLDHLLFVTCLILLTAGRWKQLLIAITGFTLAHSLTLALAAMELVYLPRPPVEAVIALSILFLATEITRQSYDNLTYRYPILVSSSFGLLHGFGFASVLMEVGLPKQGTGIALLGFNIGVEIGQLLFVSLLLVFMALLASATKQSIKQFVSPAKGHSGAVINMLMIYIVGSLSAYWTFERLYEFL